MGGTFQSRGEGEHGGDELVVLGVGCFELRWSRERDIFGRIGGRCIERGAGSC